MVRSIYKMQFWFETWNINLIRRISYKLLLYLTRVIVPIYYKLMPLKESGVLDNDVADKKLKIIVSLTSFPPRMNRIWMVLESLLRQTQKPDKIILWLAASQFPSIEDVDVRVRNLQKRGLEIKFCEDYKSHKKYYYTMKEQDSIVITVDDDIFYPENMIETLINTHNEFPGCVVCYRAHRITFTKGKIDKYSMWDYTSKNVLEPDHLLIATGCGGVLYPPKCLDNEVFNIKSIQELCPNADDIWLKCMGHLKGTKTIIVRGACYEMFSTLGSASNGLAKENVLQGHNDIQLQNVITRYKIDFQNDIN